MSTPSCLFQFDPSATRVSTQGLDPAEAHATRARHVEDVVGRALRGIPQEDRLAKQAGVANEIICLLTGTPKGAPYESPGDVVALPAERLRSIQASDATRFDHAIGGSSTFAQGASADKEDWPLHFLDVTPWPHQTEILEKLAAERERHHRFKNLVVAATGTGKTIVAALDFKRLRAQMRDPRLLVVAHRQEILKQAQSFPPLRVFCP